MSIKDTQLLKNYVDPYIVHIYDEDGYTASGVLYRMEKHVCVLTAAHVISDIEKHIAEKSTIKLQIPGCGEIICRTRKENNINLVKGQCFTAIADGYDPSNCHYDAGFIEIPEPDNMPVGLKPVPFLNHNKLEHSDEEFHVTGFPLKNAGKRDAIPLDNVHWKRILTSDVFTFTYTVPSLVISRDDWMSGYSGSGVFAEYQSRVYLIGLVSNAPGNPKDELIWEDNVSAEVIKQMLQQQGIIVPTEEITPKFSDAIDTLKDNNNEIYRCLLKIYKKIEASAFDASISQEKLMQLKDALGHSLQMKQGLDFCPSGEFPCQFSLNKRLLWAMVMYFILSNTSDQTIPEKWERVSISDVLEEDVYAQFLCSEMEFSQLIRKMFESIVIRPNEEQTVFFTDSSSKENFDTYSSKKVKNIMGNITDFYDPASEQFDILSGKAKQLKWAFISMQLVLSKLKTADDEEELIRKLISILKEEWS